MIDEQQHDIALEYVFGHLEGDAQREFEAWLQSDDEMRALVDELNETTAALALSAPQRLPPPHLREKVLSIARGDSAAPVTVASSAHRRLAWIPWAIAAGLAIVGIALQADRERWRVAANNAKAEIQRTLAKASPAPDQASKITGQLQLAEAMAKSHIDQIAELRDEVVKLRKRDALAQVQVSTLTSQVEQFARAGVIVVWDPEEQRGVVKVANLPKPEAGTDYQLWVIDPKYPSPVSGGVLTVADEAPTRVSFKPAQVIEHADKFAISIEQAGGAPTAAGPIIFAGE